MLRRVRRVRGAERRRRDTRRERGSIVLLVVAVIALMAIMGASFMQATRMQRLGTTTYEGDIDKALESVLNRIEAELVADLRDEDGRFFNQGDDAASNGTGYDEPYDFPWTNTTSGQHRDVSLFLTGTSSSADGGRFDDPWLASSQPDLVGGVWPQITSLTGAYVAYDDSGGSGLHVTELDRSTGAGWVQLAALNGDGEDWNDNVNVALTDGRSFTGSTDPNLVDADGDGMGDSRWEFAPLPQVGNVRYVAAVRIVDLGSMLNAESAMSARGDAGYFDAFVDAPGFGTPSELDFHGFMRRVEGTAAGSAMSTTWLNDLKEMLGYKLDLGGPAATGMASFAQRQSYWLDAARRYGSLKTGAANVDTAIADYGDYNHEDEFDLRRRNGLPDGAIDHSLETHLDAFLDASSTAAALTSTADAQTHYDRPQVDVTVSSGAGVFMPYMAADGTALRHKLDVNAATDDELRTWIAETMASATSFPAGFTTVGAFADQYAACFRDYADADNVLTEYNGFFGMERLPAITEVYAQRRYEATETANGDFDTDGDQVDYEMRWDAVGETGFLVELRNPWKRSIPLDGVGLVVDGNAMGGDIDGDGDVDVIDLGAPAELEPDGVLIVHKPSNANADAGNDTIADGAGGVVTEEAGYTYHYALATGETWPDAANHTLTNPGGTSEEGEFDTATVAGSTTVELRALTSAGGTKSYQKVDAVTLPVSYEQRKMDLAGSPTGTEGYAAGATAGNSDGINMLLATEAEWQAVRRRLDFPDFSVLAGVDDRDVASNELGQASKAVGATPATPIPTGSEQVLIADDRDGDFLDDTDGDGIDDLAGSDGNTGDEVDDPIEHLGELAMISLLAPTGSGATPADATLAEVWADTGTPNALADYRPDIGLNGPSPELVEDATGHPNDAIPFFAMLLERLTVLSPLADGVNNDGDDETDEGDETFVPGLLNINTASQRVLESAIPVADPALRTTLATDILTARAGDGVAHLSELAALFEALMVDGGDTNTLNDGNDDIEVDFLADPATGAAPNAGSGPNSGADGVPDDTEERARVLSWLYQNASTRSDVYVAYVLIHGYPAGSPESGAVESKRVIALFNRSTAASEDAAVLRAVHVLD